METFFPSRPLFRILARRKPASRRAPSRGRPFIDAHVHINPWNLLTPGARETLRRTQPDFDRIQRYIERPSTFVDRMDEEGVERAFLINYVAPDVMGYTPEVNGWIHKYARDFPDRLVPFGGLHPASTADPHAEMEKLLFTYELQGIKIHPPHMLVAPNDYELGHSALKILYTMCEEEGVPVMFHTGTSIFPGARNRFGDPMPIDDVAVDFPRLKIILAHAGRPLWMETALFLARRHKNVHFDLSSIPPAKLLEYLPDLERHADKALFGSDWPGPHVPSMRANADAVADLKLSREAKAQILYGNARRLIGSKKA